jgi:hypothetical protein
MNGWLGDPYEPLCRARILRFGGVLALILVVVLGVRKPDFARVRVDTLEDLERGMEGRAADRPAANLGPFKPRYRDDEKK